jgi:hypothetical protein
LQPRDPRRLRFARFAYDWPTMTSEPRRRDLDDTDVYEVTMLPQARPKPPSAPATPAPVQRVTPGAAPTPPAYRMPAPMPYPSATPAPVWPAGWQPPYDTSALAILSATLLLVIGLIGAIGLGLLLAVWDLVARLSLDTLVPIESVESARVVLVALLIAALAQVVAAIGVFAHRSWGRWLGLAISVPAIVAGTLAVIAALDASLRAQASAAGVFLALYALCFFGLVAGNSHFRRVARRR